MEDAKVVATIPTESFDAALTAVERASGFLGRERLGSTVRSVVKDEAQAEALASFIQNFAQLRRDFGATPEAFARDAVSKLPADVLSETEQRTIAERIPRVLAPKDGLKRQAKVESVVRKLGAHLDDFSLVSDLRPIFSDGRDVIEGIVPMTTLRMVVHDTDSIKSVEVSVTEVELARISEEVTRAQRKLAALKKFVLDQKGIELPESVMTRLEGGSDE